MNQEALIFIIELLKKENVDKFLALDAKVYDGGHQVSKETTIKRLNVNPYTDITVYDRSHLVGYISLCPIDEETFDQIKQGKASENDIENHVVPYHRAGRYTAYLSSIVVDKEKYPNFRGTFLFAYLQNHLYALKKRGIFVDRIIAHAVSHAGKRVLEKFSFTEIRPDVFFYSCLRQGYDLIRDHILYPSLYALSVFVIGFKYVRNHFFMPPSHDLRVWDWDSDT